MLKHKLVLADGTFLTSGEGTGGAIRGVTLTEQVSDGTDLCPGAACAACAEIELWSPGNGLRITQGDELSLYRLDSDTGTETPAGIFLAEKPTRSSANVYKVTAYDRMTLFDRDLSPWLRDNQGMFPLSLGDFLQKVCAQCGVGLASGALDGLPNGGYNIQAFYADGLTGRQLLQWVAQASGRFARMSAGGQLELAWYGRREGVPAVVSPGGGTVRAALRLAGAVLRTAPGQVWCLDGPSGYYMQGSLQYEDYTTAPIDKVQIKQSEDDVGVIWPADAQGDNALVVGGNLLLASDNAAALRPVAQSLYEGFGPESYTPLKLTLPFAETLRPGSRLDVVDAGGTVRHTLVMKRVIRGQAVELESTGNARRDSVSAVNQQRYTNINGKLLEIKTDIDGMRVSLSGKLDGEDAQTLIDQNLEGLTLSAQTGEKTSTLTLKAGQATLASTQISFTGLVSFSNLSTPGQTAVDGGNLKTGVVLSNSGNTRLDLNNGVFQVGKDTVDYVHLEPGGITWRGGADVDGATAHGQVHALDTRCYFTSDTRYQMLGWYHESTGQFAGIEIEQVDNAATFSNRVNVNGVLSCRTLLAWDAKERVVRTPYGNLGMNAMESPEPMFFDAGSAVIGGDGVCYIVADPRYAATVSPTAALRWYACATSPGQVWVERTAFGAILHGDPGMTVDWMCAGIQRGFEGVYADPAAEGYPAGGYTDGDGLLDAARPPDPGLPLENGLIDEMGEMIQ